MSTSEVRRQASRRQPPGPDSAKRPRPQFRTPHDRAAGKLEGCGALVSGGIAPAHVVLAGNADSSFITGIVPSVMGGETMGAGGCAGE